MKVSHMFPVRRRPGLPAWAGRRLVLRVMAALVLALTFFMYLRPDFALDLANRLVLCF